MRQSLAQVVIEGLEMLASGIEEALQLADVAQGHEESDPLVDALVLLK
jgi:hypothetical protein